MTAEVRQWFQRATELPPHLRVALLESECHDPVIRQEVLSLLRFDTETLPPPPSEIRDAIRSAARQEGPPAQRVGPFELGALLGCGGMGLVYEAHRIDGTVRQRVAVKFAQIAATASAEVRERIQRRFARERQLLASLRHPYIAGLIDAGTTSDGTPYAVLEQVDGIPIDTYCDTSLPDAADRIRLLLKLCDAVQFAHRNLIVHSDIKPDNILVTTDGIPKLIDFGIADDLSEASIFTSTRAFTPGYASPEQSDGGRPTVATDVYGLGAVLYRLLTGSRLRDTQTESLGDVVRSIREKDVTRPSSLRPELRGDLENILLKALQREPHRRYGSVPELADDLNRFLAGRPVRATPDSAFYRTSRFVRRNWLALSATAVVAIGLVAGITFAIHEREEALQRAADTRRLAERLLFEVHDELEEVVGATKAREKLSATAAQYLESLERDHGQDPARAWELVNAYSRLSRSRGSADSSVGDTNSGVRFARKVISLGSVVEHGNPELSRLDTLFTLYDGTILVLLEADLTGEARAVAKRMLELAPRLGVAREAQARRQSARTLDAMNLPKLATEEWARSVMLLRRVGTSPQRPRDYDRQLASTLVGWGRSQAISGEFHEAVAAFDEAIALSLPRIEATPNDLQATRHLYWSYIGLGDLYGSRGRFSLERPAEAARIYRQAQATAQRMVNADSGNDMARLDLSRAVGREGAALAATEPARGAKLLEHAYTLATRTSSSNHAGMESRYTYRALSVEPLALMGQFDLARKCLNEARELMVRLRNERVRVDERTLVRAESILLGARGDRREAVQMVRKHLDMLPAKTAPVLSQNWPVVETLQRLRTYAAGFDRETCAEATKRLLDVWRDLEVTHASSAYVRQHAQLARRSAASGCNASAHL